MSSLAEESAYSGTSESLPGAAEETRADIEFRGVIKRFGDVPAVDDVNLAVERGAFTTLLGPSGRGKTTSLRMIAGFEQPSAGDVRIGGRSVVGSPAYRRPVNGVSSLPLPTRSLVRFHNARQEGDKVGKQFGLGGNPKFRIDVLAVNLDCPGGDLELASDGIR